MAKAKKIPTYDNVSRLYMFLFRVTGILPLQQTSSYSSIISSLLAAYFQFMNAVYYTMHLTDGLRKVFLGEFKIEYVFELMQIQCVSLRFVMIYFKRAHLAQLMRVCAELWKELVGEEEPMVVKSFEKIARYLMHFFLWSGVSSAVFYSITARLVRLPPTEVNGTERRMLPFRFYIDVQEQPWYDLATAFEEVVVTGFIIIITSIESIGPFLIMMACGYLRSIQNRLLALENTAAPYLDLSGKTKSGDYANKLSMPDVLQCIKFHQRILGFCREIESFMSSLFLVQVLSTVYNISLMGLRLLQSEAIFDAAYSATLAHPEYDVKANHALLFMMQKAECPIQMTAGGYINLSIETFQRMFTSAISFFTVLRSMNA